MKVPQTTIATLMGTVVAIACGIAVLRYASPFLSDVTLLIVLSSLLTSIVGSIHGRHRTAWLGFAVFGCGFAVAAWGYSVHEALSNQPDAVRTSPTMTIPHTPLTGLLDTLYPIVHHAPPDGVVGNLRIKAISSGVVYASFHWLGHALACFLFGCAGSFVAIIKTGDS